MVRTSADGGRHLRQVSLSRCRPWSAADEVRNLVETLPADKAREACAALFGERRNDFDFDFDALIAYGYRLLDEKKIDSAVMLFESLERWRPYEANAHDSLADAYAAAGRAEDAIEHSTRAFELDKRFAHVPDRVRELTTQRAATAATPASRPFRAERPVLGGPSIRGPECRSDRTRWLRTDRAGRHRPAPDRDPGS